MSKGPQINTLVSIDAVWAAVSVDEDGTEGICAILVGSNWMPLLAADEDRLPFITEQAEMIAQTQDRLVKIIRLGMREDIREIDGRVKQ